MGGKGKPCLSEHLDVGSGDVYSLLYVSACMDRCKSFALLSAAIIMQRERKGIASLISLVLGRHAMNRRTGRVTCA